MLRSIGAQGVTQTQWRSTQRLQTKRRSTHGTAHHAYHAPLRQRSKGAAFIRNT